MPVVGIGMTSPWQPASGSSSSSSGGSSVSATCGSAALLAATAVLAGGLGAWAATAYLRRSGADSAAAAAGAARVQQKGALTGVHPPGAGPDPAGNLSTAPLPAAGSSGADAAAPGVPSSCSYCGATEGAACALRAPKADPYDPRPRSGYLSWDDYFMALAFLSSQRSKDPNKQVGAVIVSEDKVILGIGYNGFPRGCPDDELPWAKRSADGDILSTKYPYVCHAEMNAIMNKNSAALAGSCIYVTMFPCNSCAKLLIQAGIREVIYFEDKDGTVKEGPADGGIRPDQVYVSSKKMLAMTGVQVRQHRPSRPICV